MIATLLTTLGPEHNALRQHVSGPLTRKAQRANTPEKVERLNRALERVQRAAQKPVDLCTVWDLETARVAFRELEGSGLSRAQFARSRGFSVGRFRRWENRI